MTRQAIARGRAVRALARVVDAVLLRRGSRGAPSRSARWRGRRRCRSWSAAIRSSAAGADKYYNSAFLVRADGTTGGVYRKMHLVPFGEYVPLKRLLFFAAPLVEAVSDFSAGDDAGAAAGRRPSGQHGDLLRGRLSGSGAAVRRRRQRAADDDHQRRVVRPDVGAVPAFRAGVDARDREGPLSGARRQHRHQRHRRSVRPRAGADRHLSSRRCVVGEARFLRTSTVYARHGDVVRVRVGAS